MVLSWHSKILKKYEYQNLKVLSIYLLNTMENHQYIINVILNFSVILQKFGKLCCDIIWKLLSEYKLLQATVPKRLKLL